MWKKTDRCSSSSMLNEWLALNARKDALEKEISDIRNRQREIAKCIAPKSGEAVVVECGMLKRVIIRKWSDEIEVYDL